MDVNSQKIGLMSGSTRFGWSDSSLFYAWYGY